MLLDRNKNLSCGGGGGAYTGLELHKQPKLGWLSGEPQRSSYPCVPRTGGTNTDSYLWIFLYGFGGSNSGPCACKVSPLLAELTVRLTL